MNPREQFYVWDSLVQTHPRTLGRKTVRGPTATTMTTTTTVRLGVSLVALTSVGARSSLSDSERIRSEPLFDKEVESLNSTPVSRSVQFLNLIKFSFSPFLLGFETDDFWFSSFFFFRSQTVFWDSWWIRRLVPELSNKFIFQFGHLYRIWWNVRY